MADYFDPIFAGCLVQLREERKAAGLPKLTGEQMIALEPGARVVWDETWKSINASSAALGLNFDRPGGVRNDAGPRLEVVSQKMLERIRSEVKERTW